MPPTPRWLAALSALLHGLGKLSARRLMALGALTGALWVLPSVFTGLRTEDFYHLTAVKGGAIQLPWRVNLFNYIDGNVGSIYGLKDFGTVPWFTLQDYKVAFFRPLASLTHFIDYRYFPDQPWLAHLHSIGWYVLLIFAVTRVYRRLHSVTWLAALAALLYAWDDAHAHPVSWLANRNAIMATLFGVLTLWAHDVWRRPAGASRPVRWLAGVLAPICLALGLLAGEYAVGALGYLVAHACFLDAGAAAKAGLRRWLTRALVLLPSLLVTALWLFMYRRLGFGTYGTDFHLDPLRDTQRFALELFWRWPALISAQLFGVDSEAWWRLSTPTSIGAAAVAWIALLVSFYYFRAGLRDRTARFWLAGMALSTLPACAALPQDRLLFFTGLGGFALIAIAVERCLAAAGGAVSASSSTAMTDDATDTVSAAASASVTTRGGAALILAMLLFVHGVLAPMTAPQRSLIMHRFGDELTQVGEAIMRSHPDHAEHLVLLGGPSYFYVASTLGLRATRGEPVPRHLRMLHAGRGPLIVERESPTRLVLTFPHGLYNDPFDGTYRGTQYPMKPGEGLQLTWMLLIVREIDERGVPTVVEVNFQREVRRGHFHFVAWQPPRVAGTPGHFREFSLPEVGERVELPGGT
ncbi:MAG: hypothetical protein KIT72_07370 [Polyangiaceae bacterium]|nr:hypothetical protein [Polyangiaceae bacterium]MCW5790223.1 hypothetical protein [Polyangiaceae bacterium]